MQQSTKSMIRSYNILYSAGITMKPKQQNGVIMADVGRAGLGSKQVLAALVFIYKFSAQNYRNVSLV